MTTWDCQGEAARGSTNTSMCMNYQIQCLERCNQTPDNTPQGPRGAYGAIAYDSKTGAWGVSDASTSKKSAKQSALAYCGRYGKDCKVVESSSKRCAVVAESTDGAVAGARMRMRARPPRTH